MKMFMKGIALVLFFTGLNASAADLTSHMLPLLAANSSNNKSPSELVDVIAVDLSHDGNLSAQSIRSDGDGVLVLNTNPEASKEPAINPDVKNIRVVAGHNDLAILDEDKNGRIDAHDASFHYLYLLIYYQGGDKYRIIPVGHTGIRALFLKLEYMQSPSKTKKGDTFNDSVSQKAIMSDNSHRIFDSIKLEKELIDSIQKQP